MYEVIQYYTQIILLVCILSLSEMKKKNIFEEESAIFTPEFRSIMLKKLKKKGIESLIIFNDKDNEQFTRVEQRLAKQIEKAQFRLDNPDDSDDIQKESLATADDEVIMKIFNKMANKF